MQLYEPGAWSWLVLVPRASALLVKQVMADTVSPEFTESTGNESLWFETDDCSSEYGSDWSNDRCAPSQTFCCMSPNVPK